MFGSRSQGFRVATIAKRSLSMGHDDENPPSKMQRLSIWPVHSKTKNEKQFLPRKNWDTVLVIDYGNDKDRHGL